MAAIAVLYPCPAQAASHPAPVSKCLITITYLGTSVSSCHGALHEDDLLGLPHLDHGHAWRWQKKGTEGSNRLVAHLQQPLIKQTNRHALRGWQVLTGVRPETQTHCNCNPHMTSVCCCIRPRQERGHRDTMTASNHQMVMSKQSVKVGQSTHLQFRVTREALAASPQTHANRRQSDL